MWVCRLPSISWNLLFRKISFVSKIISEKQFEEASVCETWVLLPWQFRSNDVKYKKNFLKNSKGFRKTGCPLKIKPPMQGLVQVLARFCYPKRYKCRLNTNFTPNRWISQNKLFPRIDSNCAVPQAMKITYTVEQKNIQLMSNL